MQVKEIILKKREGQELSNLEIDALIRGYLDTSIKDYHMAAWLMAVYFKGLSLPETAALTKAMWKSGTSLPRARRDDYWIDKHSTGGVGDKTSLILVPLVTSVCRELLGDHHVRIPMISGRALGHSGGTLDKLEAVPGFSPLIPISKALSLLEEYDFFMMGQTESLAPADGLIYALRDVTATVECIPLIVSSILSKKLSESLDGLVFDVKVGNGAFMRNEENARVLAERLIDCAKANGVHAVAIITAMDEPLGWAVGHDGEVIECANFLKGLPSEKGLSDVTLTLASWMIHLASRNKVSVSDARHLCAKALSSPVPFDIYKKMFTNQGGNWNAFEKEQASHALCRLEFSAASSGWLSAVRARDIGVLLSEIGGGRANKESVIDKQVGFEFRKKVGDRVEMGEVIVSVRHRRKEDGAFIRDSLEKAIQVSSTPVSAPIWIKEVIA